MMHSLSYRHDMEQSVIVIVGKTTFSRFIFSMKIGIMSHVAQNFTGCALNREMYAH